MNFGLISFKFCISANIVTRLTRKARLLPDFYFVRLSPEWSKHLYTYLLRHSRKGSLSNNSHGPCSSVPHPNLLFVARSRKPSNDRSIPPFALAGVHHKLQQREHQRHQQLCERRRATPRGSPRERRGQAPGHGHPPAFGSPVAVRPPSLKICPGFFVDFFPRGTIRRPRFFCQTQPGFKLFNSPSKHPEPLNPKQWRHFPRILFPVFTLPPLTVTAQ